ncbi:hypothetical protein I79_005906 [Cricetulus griseus]|uniref:Uncharacterized protein n=1 Tax=Cricetulus griseus TaxID=10029 RepID=G3H6E9_CRIGR|nr:hypothetical protein I79_005906 [Cricetulus griseus]
MKIELEPKIHVKSCAWPHVPVTPVLLRAETRGSPGLADCQPSSRFSETVCV